MENRAETNTQIALINVSGPYAVGKDSLLTAILAALQSRGYRVSTLTTRPVSSDIDPSYRSVSSEEFKNLTSIGRWLVNSQLGGKVMYGTSVDEIDMHSRNGRIGTLTVYGAPAGAGRLREVFGPRLLSFGVLATGGDNKSETAELERRMRNRGRESASVQSDRLVHQIAQIDFLRSNPVVMTPEGPMPTFDSIIINDHLPAAISKVINDMHSKGIT